MELRISPERGVAFSLMIALGLTTLTGCGGETPKPEVEKGVPGTVVAHHYHESSVTLLPAGKGINVPLLQPERWELEIQQCDREGDAGADSEGCVTASTDVEKQVYESHPDGSAIVIPVE